MPLQGAVLTLWAGVTETDMEMGTQTLRKTSGPQDGERRKRPMHRDSAREGRREARVSVEN